MAWRELAPQSQRLPLVTHYAAMDYNPVHTHMKFASGHLDEPEEAWEKVLWSHETKIELFWYKFHSWYLEEEEG